MHSSYHGWNDMSVKKSIIQEGINVHNMHKGGGIVSFVSTNRKKGYHEFKSVGGTVDVQKRVQKSSE